MSGFWCCVLQTSNTWIIGTHTMFWQEQRRTLSTWRKDPCAVLCCAVHNVSAELRCKRTMPRV